MSTSSNNKYHHGDLKAALLKAAEHLISDRGIEALSLRGIATEVGVSHMAPYAHFKNKSELFKSVAASGFIKLANKLKNIRNSSINPEELVLLYGIVYIEFATSHPQMYKLMLSQTHPEKSMTKYTPTKPAGKTFTNSDKTLREASRRPYYLLRDCFVDNGLGENEITVQAQGAWALVHGIASLLITGQLVIDPKSSLREFLVTATKGLAVY